MKIKIKIEKSEPSKNEHRYRRMLCAVYCSGLVYPFLSCCPFWRRYGQGVSPHSPEPDVLYSIVHIQINFKSISSVNKNRRVLIQRLKVSLLCQLTSWNAWNRHSGINMVDTGILFINMNCPSHDCKWNSEVWSVTVLVISNRICIISLGSPPPPQWFLFYLRPKDPLIGHTCLHYFIFVINRSIALLFVLKSSSILFMQKNEIFGT